MTFQKILSYIPWYLAVMRLAAGTLRSVLVTSCCTRLVNSCSTSLHQHQPTPVSSHHTVLLT